MKRREAITIVSLELFNVEGESNLTAVDIANELDISPGNLYYHFKGKAEIIAELFRQFEEKIKIVLDIDYEGESSLSTVWLHLYVFLELIYAYRFLFRNIEDFVQRYPDTGRKLLRTIEVIRKGILAGVSVSAKKGMLTIRPEQTEVADRLVNSVTVILLYWNSFLSALAEEPDKETFVEDTAMQVLSLLSPYLVEEQILSVMECHMVYINGDSSF